MGQSDVLIRTARGVGALSTQSLANTLIALIFFMFFARVVTEEEMGIYGTVNLVYTILGTIGILGLNFAGARLISYYQGKGESKKANQTASKILKIAILSGLSISVIQFILSEYLSILLFDSAKNTYLLRIASVTTFSLILAFASMGFLQGLQKFRNLALFRFLSQIIRTIITVFLLLMGLGVAAVFIGYTLFNFLIVCLVLISIYKILFKSEDVLSNTNNRPTSFKDLFKFSIPMMVFQLLIYLSDSIDRFIVLNLLGVTALGTYTVALTSAMSITIILAMPIQSTLVPGMSEIYAKSGSYQVSKSIKTSSRYLSMLFVPACIGFSVLSPIIIRILAGQKYVEAILPLSLVCLGLIMYGFSSILLSGLMAIEKTNYIALTMVIVSVCEFIFTFLLIPFFGITGAAISRAIMYTLMLLLLFWFGRKFISIEFDRKSIFKTITASLIMALILIILISFFGYKLLLAPLYVIVGSVSFVIILVSLKGITKEDIQFIAQIIPGGEKLLFSVIKYFNKLRNITRIIKTC